MLRETLYRRPFLTAGVCAMCVAGAISFGFARTDLFPNRHSKQIYFYDLGSGGVFSDHWSSMDEPAPSGQRRVIAYVYSCGDCADAAARFTAYLERADGPTTTVALPQQPLQWVAPDSRAGFQVINRAGNGGPCEMPRQCKP